MFCFHNQLIVGSFSGFSIWFHLHNGVWPQSVVCQIIFQLEFFHWHSVNEIRNTVYKTKNECDAFTCYLLRPVNWICIKFHFIFLISFIHLIVMCHYWMCETVLFLLFLIVCQCHEFFSWSHYSRLYYCQQSCSFVPLCNRDSMLCQKVVSECVMCPVRFALTETWNRNKATFLCSFKNFTPQSIWLSYVSFRSSSPQQSSIAILMQTKFRVTKI